MDQLTDAAIQQLNLRYDPEHDRLLLKIGLASDAEISVWLTRRMVRALWQLLNGVATPISTNTPEIYTAADQQVIEKFKREAQEQQEMQQMKGRMDFKEAYHPRSQPLNEVPILVNQCRLHAAANGKTMLEFTSTDGSVISFSLNAELKVAMSSMLPLAVNEADWGLKLEGVASIGDKQPHRNSLH